MRSIEILVPVEVGSRSTEAARTEFIQRLSSIHGGYTERHARRYNRDDRGRMFEEPVVVFEIVTDDASVDATVELVRPLALATGSTIETKIEGETVLVDETGARIAAEAEAGASDWPARFDVAVQTVIGPELHAAQDHFAIDPKRDVRSVSGTHYYRGTIVQPMGNEVSVVVCCQSAAGNHDAAVIAERLITRWSPKAIFLMGIAAGRRGKVKIGDVVTPRVIADDTEGVAEAKERLRRPKVFPPPFSMIQQLQNFRLIDVQGEWFKELQTKKSPPVAPAGKKREYREHVASAPSHHDAAIYSSDLLLRDSEYLEEQSKQLHQQIRIGEMESAGFGAACNDRDKPVPWFVVRGVSDFGDELKSDEFHRWASHSAATYLLMLLKHGINFDLFSDE